MNTRVVMGIISFCIAMTGTIAANMLMMAMIGEINRTRPDERQISYFGFGPLKLFEVLDEYRKAYPRGRARIYALGAIVLAAIGVIGVAVCIGVLN